MKSLLPLGTDELIALILLVITLLPVDVRFLSTTQPYVILYLIMCVAVRKFAALKNK